MKRSESGRLMPVRILNTSSTGPRLSTVRHPGDSTGHKCKPLKIYELLPHYFSSANKDASSSEKGITSRSAGKMSAQKTMGTTLRDLKKPESNGSIHLASRAQPIRNVHKLYRSPGRSVRRRLDEIFGTVKLPAKENIDPLSRNKINNAAAGKQSDSDGSIGKERSDDENTVAKNEDCKHIRKSCLLPPNTIRDKHVHGQTSIPVRASSSHPVQSAWTKQPDITEESLQHLDSSKDLPENFVKNSEPSGNTTNCVVEEQRSTVIVGPKSNESNSPSITIDLTKGHPGSITDRLETLSNRKLFSAVENAMDQRGSFSKICSNVSSDMPVSESQASVIGLDRQNLLALESYLIEVVRTQELQLSKLKHTLAHVSDMLRSDATPKFGVNSSKMKNVSDLALKSPPKCQNAPMKEDGSDEQESLCIVEGGEAGINRFVEPESSPKSEDRTKNYVEPNRKGSRFSVEENRSFLSSTKVDETIFRTVEERKNSKTPSDKIDESEESVEKDTRERRRSARLAAKLIRSPMNTDDSFVNLEKELFINYPRSGQSEPSKPCTPCRPTTPGRRGNWSRKSERPLREYMAMKSAIKFLSTPDPKRFQRRLNRNASLSPKAPTDRKVISDKLLAELHDLYIESPNSKQ